ncbi:MAG: family 43 glycosylhydrolase [Clostridia bacterium]|nr:family 43 glycosylhydrolase [Clostridia bacterium]
MIKNKKRREKVKKQAVNPYLPQYEYIPDGEPYVFGNRVYVYGSHDRFNFPMFCANDYVCYSAPKGDLSDWRYEGVIYRRNQDPKNKLGLRLLFAPDVVVGADGRYYLYYAFDFMGIMGVAVSDYPAGPYEFYGHVHYKDGTLWGRKKGDSFPFDPGVLVDDDGKVYLYSGFYTPIPAVVTGFHKLKSEGGYVLELEKDMVTIKTPEKLLFPKQGTGSFFNHEFFEASSIRKYDGKYYFVYSSRVNHELCYAVSDSPTEGFVYKGTLISNGDIFPTRHMEEKDAKNYIGNNHGGMLKIDSQYYIFYHRQTNQNSYSRQACAEPLIRNENGEFLQAEMTSCGLNGGPLRGEGIYEARIACHLWAKEGTGRYDIGKPKKKLKDHPYFTQDKKDGDVNARQYIANMQDGAVAGFKYFEISDPTGITIELRGHGNGEMQVSDTASFENCVHIPVKVNSSEYSRFSGNMLNYVGNVWAGSCKELLQTVLRDEWGFVGSTVSDWFNGTTDGIMYANAAIRTGGDKMLSSAGDAKAYATDVENPGTVTAMRQACHNILYSLANSNAMDERNMKTPGWVMIVRTADVVIVLLLALWEVLTICSYRKRNKKK